MTTPPELPPPSGPPLGFGSRSAAPPPAPPWAPPTGFAAPGAVSQPPSMHRGWWVLAIAAALVFAAAAADWMARSFELTQLLTAVERSEDAMVRYQEQAAAIDVPQDATVAQRRAALAQLQAVAGQGHNAVAVAGSEVASVTFLPWHTELLDAQGAYLAHNEAWVSFLGRGALDASVLLGDDPEIEATWLVASAAMQAAVPWPAMPGLQGRVDAIFATEDDGPVV